MELCGFKVGLDRPLFLIAGPCVIEDRVLVLDYGSRLAEGTPEQVRADPKVISAYLGGEVHYAVE